jgi:hypothetical protein
MRWCYVTTLSVALVTTPPALWAQEDSNSNQASQTLDAKDRLSRTVSPWQKKAQELGPG